MGKIRKKNEVIKVKLKLKTVNLKNFRVNNHLSQIALFDTLKAHGWNGYLIYLKNIKSGEKNPPIEFIKVFANAYPEAGIDQGLIGKIKHG